MRVYEARSLEKRNFAEINLSYENHNHFFIVMYNINKTVPI